MMATLIILLISFQLMSMALSDGLHQACSSRFDFEEKAVLTLLKFERLVNKFDTLIGNVQANFTISERSRAEQMITFENETTEGVINFVSEMNKWEQVVQKGIFEQSSDTYGRWREIRFNISR